MASHVILPLGTEPAPADAVVPNAGDWPLQSVFAHFDGTSAAVPWIPVLQILSSAGATVAEIPMDASVAAGASVDATWAPFLRSGLVQATSVVTIGVLAELPGSSPQSITSDFSFHPITFADTVFDTNGMWSAGTPDRITCQVAGTYFIGAQGGFVTNGTSDRGVKLLLNGVTQLSIDEGPAGGAFFWSGFCAASASLQVGDYVQTLVAQHSGGNLNTGYCNITAFAVGGAV